MAASHRTGQWSWPDRRPASNPRVEPIDPDYVGTLVARNVHRAAPIASKFAVYDSVPGVVGVETEQREARHSRGGDRAIHAGFAPRLPGFDERRRGQLAHPDG